MVGCKLDGNYLEFFDCGKVGYLYGRFKPPSWTFDELEGGWFTDMTLPLQKPFKC